ncbi:hypothetical protein WICPIJ_001876 [Wickerhamomyces pijperi]|uniref:Uncharacterized protein n=1 Tax=Wickerhamomyces pijperi TaxID=599730 RepID=A0A9P8QAX3_WICPI|nr:hypothetical protein WICPIJ_001876 [Wickerhamomyces pijperi]
MSNHHTSPNISTQSVPPWITNFKLEIGAVFFFGFELVRLVLAGGGPSELYCSSTGESVTADPAVLSPLVFCESCFLHFSLSLCSSDLNLCSFPFPKANSLSKIAAAWKPLAGGAFSCANDKGVAIISLLNSIYPCVPLNVTLASTFHKSWMASYSWYALSLALNPPMTYTVAGCSSVSDSFFMVTEVAVCANLGTALGSLKENEGWAIISCLVNLKVCKSKIYPQLLIRVELRITYCPSEVFDTSDINSMPP